MSHDQEHTRIDPASGDRRVSIAIWANGILTVAQVVGGILSGSLALIADALHNFSDMAALVVAFAARKISGRPADERMTFGYGRVEVVAALINYTTLILIGFYLIYEGVMRIINPPEVQGWTVVVLGGIALMVDALTAFLTYSMQKGSVNIRALFLHNLSDAFASIAVVVSGALIILYDMWWMDPAITIGIALYILYLAFTEIDGPIRTLMLGSPPDIDNEAVIDTMANVAGVVDVHHVHLWQMQEHEAAIDCHVVLTADAWSRIEGIKSRIKWQLKERFDIGHSSLEFEHEHSQHENANLYGHGRPGEGDEAHVIEILKDNSDVIGLECRGKLSLDDLKGIHITLHKRLAKAHEPGLVIDLTDFEGYKGLSAIHEDLKMDIAHRSDFDRIAVVGDRKWIELGTSLVSALTSAEMRWFDTCDRDSAVQWASRR